MPRLDHEKYDFLWKVDNISFLFTSYWLHGLYRKIDCFIACKGSDWSFYIEKEERARLSKQGLKLFEEELKPFKKEMGVVLAEADKLFPEIEACDPRTFSDERLADAFKQLVVFAQRLWELFFHTEYFNHDLVQEKAETLGIIGNEYLTSSPKEVIQSKERYERCKLSLHSTPEAIKKHAKKYSFIKYNESGPTLTPQMLTEELATITSPEKIIDEIDAKHDAVIAKRKEHPLATAIREMAELKFIVRSYINKLWFGNNLMKRYLDEIQKRTGIQNFDNYDWHEVLRALKGEKVDVPKRDVYVWGKFNDWEPVIGEEARPLVDQIMSIKPGQTTMTGMIGNRGTYTGTVKIIPFDVEADLPSLIAEMKQGQVLVTGSTGPEMIKACHKAGAIVTEEGGICSHAAIVSRELGIPCVIRTEIATRILKDGDRVEVDAERGIVRKL